ADLIPGADSARQQPLERDPPLVRHSPDGRARAPQPLLDSVHVGVPFPDPDEEAIVVPLELIDVRGELAALVELEQLLGMTDPLATPDLEEAVPSTAPAPGDILTHTRPFRDLRPRPGEDEHRRPVEPRARNHPGFDLRLPGGADHRPLVGPLR